MLTGLKLPIRLTVFLIGVGAWSFQSAPPQTPDPPPQRPPIFRTEANLITVDVHVLEKGKPVSGLTAADFEILEDGVPQTIDKFDFVRVAAPRSAVPMEPSSIGAALDLASDPRNRVFVIFLDEFHVTETNSLATPMALVRTMDRLIAPTDLVGVMTPHMSASEITLGRKVDVIRDALLTNRRWGFMVEDCNSQNLDLIEKQYTVCYPSFDAKCTISPTALSMIRRRRESFTLGALRDLVRVIGARREARTAIILVSEGWPLLKPSDTLASTGTKDPPMVRVLPGGRLGTKDLNDVNIDSDECARHARGAAGRDSYQEFRDLMDDANRNNASFLIVDPGGLRVAGGHVDTLRTLAENTDGQAIADTNDLTGGLQSIIDDLSEYYLLAYYSTNTKPDGSYRSIKARVKRPGLDVRARKGYRAWTKADLEAMEKARTPPARADAAAADRTAALGRLARLTPTTALFLHAALDAASSEMYVAGELSAAASRSVEWRQGAEAQILITGPDGSPAGSGRATIAQSDRGFLARIPVKRAASGEYEAAVRLRPLGGAAPVLETVRAGAAGAPIGEPIAFRSAGRQNPVASFLWSRAEIVRVEARLSADASAPAARVLDRGGNAVTVPVTVSVRDEAGARWLIADLRLAALAPADYTMELSVDVAGRIVRRFVPIRVER